MNNANRTLADPLQRAQYILTRQGVPAQGEDTLEDPELLMEVMELREEIENAESQEDVDRVKEENSSGSDFLFLCSMLIMITYRRQNGDLGTRYLRSCWSKRLACSQDCYDQIEIPARDRRCC